MSEEKKVRPVDPRVGGTDERRKRDPRDPNEKMPTKALADRQTDPLPETDREEQPVTAHQDRRHK